MIAGGPRARAGLQIRPQRSIARRVERSPIAAERVGKESLPVGIAERNETGILARRLACAQRKIEAALGRVHAEKAEGKVAVRSNVYGVAVVHRLPHRGDASPNGESAAFAKAPSRVLRMARGMCPPGVPIRARR